MAQQQIQITPFQALQITEMILVQLKARYEKQRQDGFQHHKDISAVTSLHHARLLVAMEARLLIQHQQAVQQAASQRTQAVVKGPGQAPSLPAPQ